MRLKNLEIQGFKSFEDKTVIRFDESITGVVGPNGCGKSNIVDAIRWVMGEQSAKHLRGKVMEDVIFAGSQNRQPAASAAVELTFSTMGVSTPPQYEGQDEISICRKLYRSGESEYYINKQGVRLKDITDLFLGTGIGTKAYSIIEQGQVGQIINVKPEERRFIVDEAAGISKFKSRREAAIRKIEATQQNLLRLADIIAEIERQIGTLERQAKKAQRFQVIRAELMKLDLTLAAADYARCEQEEKDVLGRLKTFDEQVIVVGRALQEGENWIEGERLKLLEAERGLADLQQLIFEWHNRLRLTESKIVSRRENGARLERQIQTIETRLSELVIELAGTENGLSQINQRLLDADLDACACEESVTTLEAGLEEREFGHQDLSQAIEAARARLSESSQALAEIRARKQGFNSRLEELTAARRKDQEELGELTSRYGELARLHRDTNAGLMEIRQLKLSLHERTGELEQRLQGEKAQVENEAHALAALKEELLAKQSRLHSLEELERSFEGYSQGPRQILKRKSAGEMGPLTASVAEIVDTEPRYECAVSAVLGERLQYVVVKDYSEGVACIAHLKGVEGGGRGSFVALEAGASQGEGGDDDAAFIVGSYNNTQLPGIEGYLQDFVSVKPEYARLKRFLFGDVLLADTLGHALDVWQNLKKPVVTYEGEVISADGILTGGSLENTSKALLAKKREIRELGGTIHDLVTCVRQKEEVCLDLGCRIKAMTAELEGIKASSHQEDVRLASQEKDVAHLRNEVDSTNQRRGQLSQQVFTATEALEVFEHDLAEALDGETRHATVVAESQALIDEQRDVLEASHSALSVAREELTREKIRKAQATAQRGYLAQEIERLITERLQLKRDIVARQEEARLLHKLRLFNEDRVVVEERFVAKVVRNKDAIEADHRGRKQAFDTLHQSVQRREIEIKDQRREHNAAKDSLSAAQLEMSTTRSQMQRLADQILDRYRIFLVDVYKEHLTPTDGFEPEAARARAEELRQKIDNLGAVNLGAIEEHTELAQRFAFLTQQSSDLKDSLGKLEQVIRRINETTKTRFADTFELINNKFSQLFPKLFRGGRGYLELTQPDNILETGVDIIAQPPGKKLQSITLMSGGEKALTALCVVFSIFLIKPSPFCLLDEVDAPLDDVNVDRYIEIIKEMADRTQFVMITHNKRTMQITDSLFGITMQEPGVSQLVSVEMA